MTSYTIYSKWRFYLQNYKNSQFSLVHVDRQLVTSVCHMKTAISSKEKVIIGNCTIKNLSMSEMNHDGVEGNYLLAEFHIVQENTDTDSDGDMESETELEISGKVGDDGDMKGKSNILEETIDVQSLILVVSQQLQYHDFDKENNPMDEILVIRSPPVPTR